MRRSRLTFVLAIAVAAVFGPAVAWGNCPAVPNGTFATDVSGWSNFATWDGTVGNPTGSDKVGPVTGGGPGLTCGNSLSSCLPVTSGDSCSLSAQAFIPVGQPTSGLGVLSYLFYSDAGCSTYLSSSANASVPGTMQGTWIPLSVGPVTIPTGAQSARISLNVCAAPSTSMTINWDNIVAGAPGAGAVPTLGSGALLVLGALLALTGILVLRSVRL